MTAEWSKTPPALEPNPDAALHWYAIRTNPKAERMVQAQIRLLGDGYRPFYPFCTVRQRRYWSRGRTIEEVVEKPYFSRYVFAGIAPWKPLFPLFSMQGVSEVVSSMTADGTLKPQWIRFKQMERLMKRADERGQVGVEMTSEPDHIYQVGDVVEFDRHSPFAGHTANIIRLDRHGYLHLSWIAFGRETTVDVHHTALGEIVSRSTLGADAISKPKMQSPS